MYHLPRDGTGRSSQDRTISSDSPRLPTPFGGPGEDSGVEEPGGHIIRGEDDDIAFGVPIAEHSPMIVRPGNRETEETAEQLSTSGTTAHPSLASEALLHLRREGRAHTAFQPGPLQPTNMGPATQIQTIREPGPREISTFLKKQNKWLPGLSAALCQVTLSMGHDVLRALRPQQDRPALTADPVREGKKRS